LSGRINRNDIRAGSRSRDSGVTCFILITINDEENRQVWRSDLEELGEENRYVPEEIEAKIVN